MVCGNDQTAFGGHVLEPVEFDLPEQTAESSNNGAHDFKRPLRKHRGRRRNACALFLHRICSVRTQVIVILQRPFPVDELDVNSLDSINAGASSADGRKRCDAVLFTRQSNEAA